MINSSYPILNVFSSFGFIRLANPKCAPVRQLYTSVKCSETFVSGVILNGKQIKVSQHYFEEPILQPRSAISDRREADLTGLKGTSNLLLHL